MWFLLQMVRLARIRSWPTRMGVTICWKTLVSQQQVRLPILTITLCSDILATVFPVEHLAMADQPGLVVDGHASSGIEAIWRQDTSSTQSTMLLRNCFAHRGDVFIKSIMVTYT